MAQSWLKRCLVVGVVASTAAFAPGCARDRASRGGDTQSGEGSGSTSGRSTTDGGTMGTPGSTSDPSINRPAGSTSGTRTGSGSMEGGSGTSTSGSTGGTSDPSINRPAGSSTGSRDGGSTTR